MSETPAAPGGTLEPGHELEVSPQDLDDEGAGLCATADGVLHVTGALVGEQVRARVEHLSPHRTHSGGRQAFGRALAVLVPSGDRTSPACPGHGRCGGCPLQHLRYGAQLEWKRARVAAALAGHPALAAVEVAACVPSPRELGYRNQAKYVYGPAAGGGTLTLGAYAPRSHELVDLLGCRVVEPVIDQVAQALRALLVARRVEPFHELRRTGVLRYVVLRASAEQKVLCTLVTGGKPLEDGAALADALRAAVPAVVGVLESRNDSRGNAIFGPQADERVLSGADSLIEQVAGVPVALGPRAFLQLNRQVAAAAYAAIRQVAEGLGPLGRVVDLFAGVGGISFALRGLAHETVAVEQNPTATAAGAAAAASAGLTGMKFVTASADAAGPLLAGAELVVLNPPRAGAAAVVPAVAAAGPRAVAYLSCNPTTLARDLAILTAHGGLRLVQVQPFDMLPHTPHIEVLAVLKTG